jgi:hypothetical protein
MRTNKIIALAVSMLFVSPLSVTADESADTRQLINLPDEIRNTMLANMRDHIAALDDIIGAVQEGRYDDVEDIAEYRLGWSSLVRKGDSEIAKHWAEPMQKMADQMYRSASNFVIVAQNASVEGDVKSYQKMLGALKEVTSACRACHQAYRVR